MYITVHTHIHWGPEYTIKLGATYFIGKIICPKRTSALTKLNICAPPPLLLNSIRSTERFTCYRVRKDAYKSHTHACHISYMDKTNDKIRMNKKKVRVQETRREFLCFFILIFLSLCPEFLVLTVLYSLFPPQEKSRSLILFNDNKFCILTSKPPRESISFFLRGVLCHLPQNQTKPNQTKPPPQKKRSHVLGTKPIDRAAIYDYRVWDSAFPIYFT